MRSVRVSITTLAVMAACAAGPAVVSAAPSRPALATPAEGATVESIPAFTWKSARGAARYEFQLSADANFASIVIGPGKGSFTTLNTAATIGKSLPDGTYYWRVRGINAKGDAGAWSGRRELVKAWSTAPVLLEPGPDTPVTFPGMPLILKWSSVPRAFKYNVYIATDPGLGSLAVSDRGNPIETSGTVYSPGVSLPPGRYYWAVEPIDADKHRGRRSAVGSFLWSWPTATPTLTSDLIADQRVMDPRFSWDPVPGAVAYEVEVNSSSDFSTGSKVCCTEVSTGTSLAPVSLQPNNVYNWRVRALDAQGNAGQWNVGTPFDKNFGNYRGLPGIPPTVAGLRLRDNDSPDVATDLDPMTAVIDTDTPVFTWDAVPGASHYEVQVVPRVDFACNWSTTRTDRWLVETAATAWTPLGGLVDATKPDPSYPTPATDSHFPITDEEYCFRVRGKSKDDDVYSEWSQYPGTGSAPAFRAAAPPPHTPVSGQVTMSDSDYLAPQSGTTHNALPLFTWKRVTGAQSYWVVVSRDQLFTNIVDLALTRIPAYAPRQRTTPWTYEDDDSPLYWAVLPAKGIGGAQTTSQPPENFERPFLKQSTPPTPLAPANTADLTEQPEFRWSPVDGARDYRLQVSQDPTFAERIEDVVTTSTAYTAAKYYPADTLLYWRVRANDIRNIGLSWSATQTFRRRLPAPVLSPGNPIGGSTMPAFTWQPVQGARSYSVHVDQVDGTRKDFTLYDSAITPTTFYGTGVWRWQVRANYGATATTVSSGYTPLSGYARRIPAPDGAWVDYSPRRRMLVSWDAVTMVERYRVELSTTNSFSSTFANVTTTNLAWAPDLTSRALDDGGEIFWRVAAVDEGNAVGAWAGGQFKAPKRMIVRVQGSAARRRTSQVKLTVTDVKGRPLRGARVSVAGAAVAKAKRTGKRGTVQFKVRPRRKGSVKFRVTLAGHRPETALLKVGGTA